MWRGTDFSGFNTGKPAHNAKGGIYSEGAFLTYFAEDSAEAAIPIDGTERAKNLWLQTGQMLGMFKADNAQGLSISGGITGNSFAENTSVTAKADIIVKTDKSLGEIQKLQQKISELQAQGKEVSQNLYTNITDKTEKIIQNINKAYDDIIKESTDLNKSFVGFKIESNFSHMDGAQKVQAQMWLDTSDALDKTGRMGSRNIRTVRVRRRIWCKRHSSAATMKCWQRQMHCFSNGKPMK